MSKPIGTADLSPVIRRVIQAAQQDCPKGQARALADLIELARTRVPARGTLDPASETSPISTWRSRRSRRSTVAQEGEETFQKALRAANLDIDRRDDIESGGAVRTRQFSRALRTTN